MILVVYSSIWRWYRVKSCHGVWFTAYRSLSKELLVFSCSQLSKYASNSWWTFRPRVLFSATVSYGQSHVLSFILVSSDMTTHSNPITTDCSLIFYCFGQLNSDVKLWSWGNYPHIHKFRIISTKETLSKARTFTLVQIKRTQSATKPKQNNLVHNFVERTSSQSLPRTCFFETPYPGLQDLDNEQSIRLLVWKFETSVLSSVQHYTWSCVDSSKTRQTSANAPNPSVVPCSYQQTSPEKLKLN